MSCSSVKSVELSVDNIINWKNFIKMNASAVFLIVEVFQEITSESMFKMCSRDRNGVKLARNRNTNFFKTSS